MTDSPRPKIHEQVKSSSDITFGKHFSDHMLQCHWDKDSGWEKPKIVPYGDIPMSPALSALHYATEVGLRMGFENEVWKWEVTMETKNAVC